VRDVVRRLELEPDQGQAAVLASRMRTAVDRASRMPADAALAIYVADATIRVFHLPVQVEDRVLGAVSIRFSGTAVPMKLALERFLPKLREAAGRIRTEFVEQQRDPAQQHRRPAQVC